MCVLNFLPFPKLSTPRLRLRQLHIVDAESIFELRSDETVMRFIEGHKMTAVEEAYTYIEKINGGIAEDEWVFWSIILKETGSFIGTVCIWNIDKENGIGELGYELIPKFHHKGYMREAVVPVISYAFGQMRLNALEASTHSENLPSLRLLEAAGFSASDKSARKNGWVIYRRERDNED